MVDVVGKEEEEEEVEVDLPQVINKIQYPKFYCYKICAAL